MPPALDLTHGDSFSDQSGVRLGDVGDTDLYFRPMRTRAAGPAVEGEHDAGAGVPFHPAIGPGIDGDLPTEQTLIPGCQGDRIGDLQDQAAEGGAVE